MARWKIHIVWSIVTVVVAGIWGHYVASSLRSGKDGNEVSVLSPIREPRRSPEPTADSQRSVEAIVAPLDNPPLRVEAGNLGTDRRGAPTLTTEEIQALLRGPDPQGRWRALRAIAELKDGKLKLFLFRDALSITDFGIRANAIQLIGEMGGEGVPEILEGILNDKDLSVRLRAAHALGLQKASGPNTVAALLEAFNSSDVVDFRVACACSLYKLGQEAPASQVLETLRRSLESPDGAIRREAAENLASLQAPATLPLLAQALRDSNGDVRSEAVTGLLGLGLPEVIPLLEQAANDPHPNVAQGAKEALDYFRNQKR